MKYIVYRGLHKDRGITLTILSKDDSYWGRYCAPILQRKKLSLKQIEKMWKDGMGVVFGNTMRNNLHQFHNDIFYSSSWEEREKYIAKFEDGNDIERKLPGHYEF